MLKFYGSSLAASLTDLAILETALACAIEKDGPAVYISEEMLRDSIRDAKAAEAACSHLEDMRPAAEAAQRLVRNLTSLSRPLTYGEMQVETRNLRDIIFAELRREQAITIPRRYQKYVDNDALFGAPVRTAFASATADIRDAGNAFAVGLTTATVFHLMRAVEVGLRALADERQVALPKGREHRFAEWQELITAIRSNVDKAFGPWKKSDEKSAVMEFYGDLLNQFSGFKDAFRNHVMHSRAVYNAREAEAIMASVKGFMKRLAQHIDEHGTPIAWKVPP